MEMIVEEDDEGGRGTISTSIMSTNAETQHINWQPEERRGQRKTALGHEEGRQQQAGNNESMSRLVPRSVHMA